MRNAEYSFLIDHPRQSVTVETWSPCHSFVRYDKLIGQRVMECHVEYNARGIATDRFIARIQFTVSAYSLTFTCASPITENMKINNLP